MLGRWTTVSCVVLASACAGSTKLLGHPVHKPVAIVIRVSEEVAKNSDGGAIAALADAMLEGLRERGLDGQVYAAPDEHPPAPRIEVRVGTADPGSADRREGGQMATAGAAVAAAPIVGVAGTAVWLSGAGSVRLECWVFEEGKPLPSFHRTYSALVLGRGDAAASAGASLGEEIMNSVFTNRAPPEGPLDASYDREEPYEAPKPVAAPSRSAPPPKPQKAGATASTAANADLSGDSEPAGRLPPELIQRRVREHYDSFRACYDAGLARNPKLKGRVSARFVIGRDGTVSNVADAGSELPDAAVVRCVLTKFSELRFPEPEGGIVTVVYPIMLEPG